MIEWYFACLTFLIFFLLILWKFGKATSKRLYIRPLWGLGNRLRSLRCAFEVGKKTGRDVILVDGKDDAFFQGSLKDTLHLTVPSVHFDTCFDYHKKIGPDEGKCELTLTSKQIKEIAKFNGDVYIDGVCNILSHEVNLDTRTMWIIHPFHLKQNDVVVGVHIRQGSLADYEYQNFFGAWQTHESRLPGPPYYCCFKDISKNKSSCPSNIQHLDGFVDTMRAYGPLQKFRVVADRPGCSIDIHSLFPNQIEDMNVFIGSKTDTTTAANDWSLLATCNEIIVSDISSFSYEASRVHDAKIIRIPKNVVDHMQDKIFITYGNSKFIKSRERIENEAKATNMFTKVRVYTEKDICGLVDADKYPDTYKVFNEMTRLGGYEMWKPFIIHDTMSRAKEGDIVVYADAGCTVHNNPAEIQKTFDAINNSEKGVSHCNNTGGLRGHRRFQNRMDTMRQFLRQDEVEPFLRHNNGMEYEANRFIFRKCDFSMQFVNAFREAAIHHPWLWTDNPSSIPNLPEFSDHRHGQSIYQLLAFRYGILGGDCNFFTWLTADRIRE